MVYPSHKNLGTKLQSLKHETRGSTLALKAMVLGFYGVDWVLD